MNIREVEVSTCHYVTNTNGFYFRRNSENNWEQLYGDSWETVFYDAELEEAFQTFLKNSS
jgi:hypothetical protein